MLVVFTYSEGKRMRKLYDIVAAVSLLIIIGLAVIATKGGRYAQYRIMR